MFRTGHILLITLFLFSQPAVGQHILVVDISGEQANYLELIYKESIPADHRFINGSVYQEAYGRANGHQYFLSQSWYEGSLFMNHKWYENIPLRYDIHNDVLVYNHMDESGNRVLRLNSTRIDSFSIEEHTFCQFRRESAFGKLIEPGFYEVITTGTASFYQRWTKRFDEPSQYSPGAFIPFNDLYILKDMVFHKISRRPGLVRALKDRQREVRAFIRENNILIGSGDITAIKRVIDYYNSLQQ